LAYLDGLPKMLVSDLDTNYLFPVSRCGTRNACGSVALPTRAFVLENLCGLLRTGRTEIEFHDVESKINPRTLGRLP